MPERGRVSVIRDPAVAIAASKCWLARWHTGGAADLLGIPVDSFHPTDCGFCEFPLPRLKEALAEFGDWAGLYESEMGIPKPVRVEVEMFLAMPREEQQRLVKKAQGHLEEEVDDDDDA